jgi:Ca-activated chloride channel family protein
MGPHPKRKRNPTGIEYCADFHYCRVAMKFPLTLLSTLLLLGSLILSGCIPTSQGQSDEEKEPHFLAGKSRVNAMDFKGAIESYEKTLELDPKDRDAKYNLELALKKLQENPEKKKESSSNKEQKKQNSSSKENQQSQNQQTEQQKSATPREQESKGDSQKQNAKPKESDPPQNQPQKGEQKQGMDPKEALRILDAINSQEKKEQRKQILKIQRAHISGKDW